MTTFAALLDTFTWIIGLYLLFQLVGTIFSFVCALITSPFPASINNVAMYTFACIRAYVFVLCISLTIQIHQLVNSASGIVMVIVFSFFVFMTYMNTASHSSKEGYDFAAKLQFFLGIVSVVLLFLLPLIPSPPLSTLFELYCDLIVWITAIPLFGKIVVGGLSIYGLLTIGAMAFSLFLAILSAISKCFRKA